MFLWWWFIYGDNGDNNDDDDNGDNGDNEPSGILGPDIVDRHCAEGGTPGEMHSWVLSAVFTLILMA